MKKAPTKTCKCLIYLVSRAGIEPTTYGLKVSTSEFPNLLNIA